MSFRQHSYLRLSLCPCQTDVFIYMSDLIRKTKDSAHSLVLLLLQDKRGGEIWTAEITLNKKACTCDSNHTAVCSQLYAVTAVCGLTGARRRVNQCHWFTDLGPMVLYPACAELPLTGFLWLWVSSDTAEHRRHISDWVLSSWLCGDLPPNTGETFEEFRQLSKCRVHRRGGDDQIKSYSGFLEIKWRLWARAPVEAASAESAGEGRVYRAGENRPTVFSEPKHIENILDKTLHLHLPLDPFPLWLMSL